MMTMEEQKSGPSKVDDSTKLLDANTQESLYPEDLNRLIDKTYLLLLEGKKISDDNLIVLVGRTLRYIAKFPTQLTSLQKEYIEILQEENIEAAMGNASDFIHELLSLGADDKVCDIILKQFELHFLFNEYYNDSSTGTLLKDDDINFLLNTISGFPVSKANELYQRYKEILQKENIEAAMGNASDFIHELSSLGADDKVCDIILKQFELHFLLNEYYNDSSAGKLLKEDDVKFLLGTTHENKDLNCLLYELIQDSTTTRSIENLFNELSRSEADEKIFTIISNQLACRFDFLNKYYSNEQVADKESIRDLLNKIRGLSSEDVDKLCESYENIVKEKDREKAVRFMRKLLSIGANEPICDIIQAEFRKSGIVLPAEVGPSKSGNLYVPEGAKYTKRREYGGKFVSEEYLKKAGLDLKTIGFEEKLVAYFRKEIIEPFNRCKEELPVHIKKQLEDKKLSIEIKEEANGILNVLKSEKINNDFQKSLEIVKNFLKKLLSGEKLFKCINGCVEALIAVLPNKEEFELIRKSIIIMYYERNGWSYESEDEKRNALSGTPFYSMLDKIDLWHLLEFIIYAIFLCLNELFPHDPCLGDIMQGQIGDCYLLAAIIALLNSNSYGPNFIRNMMIDNGDKTVTVRLHAQNQREFDEGKFHVKYVNVDKCGLMSNANSALWVQVIEKAYISIGANLYEERKKGKLREIKGKYEDYKKLYPRSVEDLYAGFEYNAFMVLAGIKCDHRFVRWSFSFNKKDEEKIKWSISQKLPVTCAFESNFSYKGYKFLGRHGYSIIGGEGSGGEMMLKLANPHNAERVMVLSLREFKKHVTEYTIADKEHK